jgi:hypothetical protein
VLVGVGVLLFETAGVTVGVGEEDGVTVVVTVGVTAGEEDGVTVAVAVGVGEGTGPVDITKKSVSSVTI